MCALRGAKIRRGSGAFRMMQAASYVATYVGIGAAGLRCLLARWRTMTLTHLVASRTSIRRHILGTSEVSSGCKVLPSTGKHTPIGREESFFFDLSFSLSATTDSDLN